MADNANPGILRNLRVKRVSLVDMGANFDTDTGDGAHIMLYKAATKKDGPSLGSVHVDSPSWDNDDQDDYEKADLTGPGRRSLPDSAFAAVWTDAQGKKHRKLPIHDAGHLAAARGRIDSAQIPADVKAAARRKIDAKNNSKEKNVKKSMLKSFLGLFAETDAAKRTAGLAELTKAVEDDNDDDDIAKAHTDDPMCKCADCSMKDTNKRFAGDIAKAVSAVEKKHAEEVALLKAAIAESKTAVEVEKNQRLDREMVDVLKSFKATPFNFDTDVAKFRKMKESSPEAFERTMEVLKAQDAQIAAGQLFKDIGTGRSGGAGNAWAQIEAKADAMLEKGNTNLTREQAIEKVMLNPANKALIKQYRAEQQ